MADVVKDLEIRAVFDPSQAVSGAAAASEAVEGIGDAATSAGAKSETAGDKAAGAFEDLRGKSADVDKAIDAVAEAMGRLESKSTAPNTIAKNAALAQLELETLKQKAEAAGISLEQLGPEASGGLAQAQKAIDATVDKARRLNEAILDTKEKAGLGSRTMRELAEETRRAADASEKAAAATERSAQEAAHARQEFSAFGTSMQQLVRQGADVEKEVADVVKALSNLEKAGDSPRALIKNAALAEIELEKLRAKIDQVAKSGVTIGTGVTSSLRTAESQISSAVAKSGQLADRFGDLRVKAGFSAEGIRNLASSMGSSQTLFSTMETTLGGVGGKLGLIGLAAHGIVDGFRLAAQAGKALGDALGSIPEKAAAQELALANAAATTAEIADATRAAERGQIAYSGSFQGTVENLRLYSIAQNRGSESTKKWALELSGLAAPARSSFAEIGRQADAMSAILQREFGKSTQSGLLWVKANKSAIDDVIAKHREFGEAIPAELRKAIEVYEEHQRRLAETGKTLDELTKKYADNAKGAEALATQIITINQRRAEEQVAIANSTTAATLDVDVKLKALNKLGLADEEYRAAKKKILADLETAILASSEKERESAKKSEEATEAAKKAYAGQAGAIDSVLKGKAGLVGKTEEEVEAGKSVQRYLDDVGKALLDQEQKYGTTKSAAEKFRDAMKEVRTPVIETKAGTEQLNLALEAFKNKLNGMDTQVASLTKEMGGFGGSMDEPTTKAWALAAALNAVAAAAHNARAAAAAAASGGGGGAIAPSDPNFVGPPAPGVSGGAP